MGTGVYRECSRIVSFLLSFFAFASHLAFMVYVFVSVHIILLSWESGETKFFWLTLTFLLAWHERYTTYTHIHTYIYRIHCCYTNTSLERLWSRSYGGGAR